MDSSLAQFLENMGRARTLSGLAEALPKVGLAGIDVSDLHRAALVLGVSALDFFVHEIVREGLLKVHSGEIPATEASLSFKVALSSVQTCLANPMDNGWLDAAIRSTHTFQTFQHPDKIADAIRLISTVKLWDSVAAEVGSDGKSVKTNLTALVDRRNKIAHEADMDHLASGARWSIDHVMVTSALDFVEAVVRAIAKVADAAKAVAAAPP